MKYADVNALLCELGQDVIIKDPVTGQERADTVIRTADLCVTRGKVPSPWISSKVKLPEKYVYVLFAAPREEVRLGLRSDICEVLVDHDVVYWMPLPDPPEVEE